MNTLEDSINQYQPALGLTSLMSRKALSVVRHTTFTGTVFFSVGGLISINLLDGLYSQQLFGAALISGAFWIEQILTFSYHNSYYFRGLNSIIGIGNENISGATYDVAEAVLKNPKDVTLAFCDSKLGTGALIRSGISQNAIDAFFKSPRQPLSSSLVMIPDDEIFSIISLGKYLLKHDPDFRNLFESTGIKEETLIGSLRWVAGSYHKEKRNDRWWSKDNLSQTTSIGREWAFGTAHLLGKFSRDIRTSSVFSTLGSDSAFALEKIKEIESTLARSQSSNVLIVGEAGVGKIDLVMEVANRMRLGKSLSSISGKQIIVLDTTKLFATHRDKQELELTLINMFTEEAESLGVFVPELIDQYLALPQIQFITTDTPSAYHNHTETLGSFARRFSEVLIDSPDLSSTTRILQGIALQNEYKNDTLFTYPALLAITSSADRYIVEGVMPDKAISLLIDVATKARENRTSIITEDFVFSVVSTKTGVPVGPIQDSEKDLLLNLEDRLHQQIIGQKEAVDSIARTMRRARAGIQSADKPTGSFLFLGPTGVGKTETAKALAKVFFGTEEKIQRIDMSEYSGEDALGKLLGNENTQGVLPTKLLEHPYCVLLLDEFEKASQPVHDVFLQILDEGIFTNSKGTKINARNSIIIATSNAGSQLILRTVQQRKDLSHLSQEIIDNIIREGAFRPELINRFDSTIIFEPLSIEEQTEVAELMLQDLKNRMKDKGYGVEVSRELLEALVKKGYHPEFGARPMKRIIQDMIEEKIAKKIISGEAHKGNTIRLGTDDFARFELGV
jgi:ATP-dependent Clp protease ATP-binding subunit ClpC